MFDGGWPGGWRGKQQRSHARNPGETSSGEERSPQQDEGGGLPLLSSSCFLFFYSILFSTTFAQNENRMALISALDETSSLFIGTGKISTLGSLHRGESLVSDVSALLYNRVQKWSKWIDWVKKHISVGRRLSRGSVNVLLPVRQHRRWGRFQTFPLVVIFSLRGKLQIALVLFFVIFKTERSQANPPCAIVCFHKPFMILFQTQLW